MKVAAPFSSVSYYYQEILKYYVDSSKIISHSSIHQIRFKFITLKKTSSIFKI